MKKYKYLTTKRISIKRKGNIHKPSWEKGGRDGIWIKTNYTPSSKIQQRGKDGELESKIMK